MMRTGTSGTPTMTRSEKLKEHNMFRSLREVLRLNLSQPVQAYGVAHVLCQNAWPNQCHSENSSETRTCTTWPTNLLLVKPRKIYSTIRISNFKNA